MKITLLVPKKEKKTESVETQEPNKNNLLRIWWQKN